MRKLMVIGVLIVLTACGGGADEPETADAGSAATSSQGLPPLVSVPATDYTANHVGPPVSFDTSPSTGGDHYQFWQNCGYYTVEAIEGAATHTMEHGAIWITYNESQLSDADLGLLQEMSAKNGKLLISPYNHDDTIVLSAWGVQQRGVAAPSSAEGGDAIAAFIEDWQDNPELAEAGVRCNGAVGIPPEDVRSFEDGQEIPAEFD